MMPNIAFPRLSIASEKPVETSRNDWRDARSGSSTDDFCASIASYDGGDKENQDAVPLFDFPNIGFVRPSLTIECSAVNQQCLDSGRATRRSARFRFPCR